MAAVTYHYKTKGTCSTDINLQVEDGVITDIEFWSGCNGNLQGICRLVKGMFTSCLSFKSRMEIPLPAFFITLFCIFATHYIKSI